MILKPVTKIEEARLAIDQEVRFLVRNRRNKLLGLWAAAKLGLGGEEADRYARQVVQTGVTTPHDPALIDHIVADADARGISLAAEAATREMERLEGVARLEFGQGQPKSPQVAA